MSSNAQTRLLGEPSGESVSIETSGRVIRPALAVPNAIVNECKPTFDADGMHIRVVDPPNVSMVRQQIYPGAFEHYYLDGADELEVGLNLDGVTSKLSNARLGKSTDDPVGLDVDATRTLVEVSRDYDDTAVTYADEQLNIDPDAVRSRPDMPDLDLFATATVGVGAFKDAVDHIDATADHATFRERDGSLVLTGGNHDDSPATYATAVEFEGVADVDERDAIPESMFSLDFLTNFATAIKRAKVDTLEIHWGEEFPIEIHYKRRIGGELAYDGVYMLAPRERGDEQ